MSEMIERVARALHTTSLHSPAWDKLNSTEKYTFEVAARAAIEAMREPTDAPRS